jgi:hypothetical protein
VSPHFPSFFPDYFFPNRGVDMVLLTYLLFNQYHVNYLAICILSMLYEYIYDSTVLLYYTRLVFGRPFTWLSIIYIMSELRSYIINQIFWKQNNIEAKIIYHKFQGYIIYKIISEIILCIYIMYIISHLMYSS